MLLLLLDQTCKKKPRLQKVNINHSKSRFYYFGSGQHLYQLQRGHEKKR